MTWFGNSPLIVRPRRSTYTWTGGALDLTGPKHHYGLALKHAKDDELKAAALYGLAKVELAETRMSMVRRSKNLWLSATINPSMLKAYGYGQNFRKLIAYRHTDYYREVIQSCGIFRARNWF